MTTSTEAVIQAIYGAASILLYGYVNYLVIKHNPVLKSSYLILFIVSSITNVLTYLNSYPVLRLPNTTCKKCLLAPLFDQGYFFGLDFMRFFYVHFAYVQASIIVVMSFNRMTALTFPVIYRKIWKKILLPMIFLSLLGPLACDYPTIFADNWISYEAKLGDYYAAHGTEKATRRIYTLTTFLAISSISTAIMTAVSIYSICRSPNLSRSNLEVKLFVHNLANILALAATAFLITFVLIVPGDHTFVNFLLPYASDMLTLVSPYIFLMCSSETRQKMIFFRRIEVTPVLSESGNGGN